MEPFGLEGMEGSAASRQAFAQPSLSQRFAAYGAPAAAAAAAGSSSSSNAGAESPLLQRGASTGAASDAAASAAAAAAAVGRQLTQQLTHAMNSSLSFSSFSFKESPRGEQHSPLVYYLSSHLLRGGLLLQLLGVLLSLCCCCCCCGSLAASFRPFPLQQQHSQVYVHLNCCAAFLFFFGALQFAAFQALIADNSKFTVGFRAAAKTLGCAAALQLLGAICCCCCCMHLSHFVSARWLGKHLQQQEEWALCLLGQLLLLFAAAALAVGFAALELYHDKGSSSSSKAAAAIFLLYILTAVASKP
ncbi:hypothetical protein, conserved [Eimeria tenella]|uniref:Uncharacterized protein n=1 Tax=Eimeria tenella TaxID=5802 RepID=U6KJ69_EIMTE|nr:hypothetical protein, conserved [Eimeria tenella]CDJ37969.1 hypothetical protein, conserved [Eimeria tenella]|eukprot:XP_013228807.1 hypothetical protein, conserved [Eimeria tenella]